MSTAPQPPSAASELDGVRRAVIAAGYRAGADDRELVLRALTHEDPSIRVAALGAADRLDELTAERLSAAMRDPEAEVRRRAVELAARAPGTDLLEVLHDPDPTVVEVAAWAAGEHEQVPDTVLERLIELATDADDALVRESSAAALGAIGDRRGVPAILQACTDKPAVRRRAVLALAPFMADDPDGAVDAAIERALTDRDWQVRQAAEDLRRATADSDAPNQGEIFETLPEL